MNEHRVAAEKIILPEEIRHGDIIAILYEEFRVGSFRFYPPADLNGGRNWSPFILREQSGEIYEKLAETTREIIGRPLLYVTLGTVLSTFKLRLSTGLELWLIKFISGRAITIRTSCGVILCHET